VREQNRTLVHQARRYTVSCTYLEDCSVDANIYYYTREPSNANKRTHKNHKPQVQIVSNRSLVSYYSHTPVNGHFSSCMARLGIVFSTSLSSFLTKITQLPLDCFYRRMIVRRRNSCNAEIVKLTTAIQSLAKVTHRTFTVFT